MPKEMSYDVVMDEQMEDLRERMRLLQGDRKANVDLLESSKQANKESIRQLREENKELRKQMAAIQAGATMTSGYNGDEDEIRALTRQLESLRKKHDTLKHKTTAESEALEKLKDEVKDLSLESWRPDMEDSNETRKIRMLENQLDKAMIKFNEAQSIRKTYEQIVKRLKEERVGFDHQVAAIERTLMAKTQDYEELLLLSGDAQHAKEVTAQELDRVREHYEHERRLREREIREREQIMQVKVEMNHRLQERAKEKNKIVHQATNELTDDDNLTIQTSLAFGQLHPGGGQVVPAQKMEHRSKIHIFENAFRKIKEATGVSDVNEVIQKFITQASTADNLSTLTKENQARLEKLLKERSALKANVDELKYCGSTSGHRRKLMDDHEESLSIATAKFERSKVKYERLSKMLVTVKAGVEHLADKVESVREDGGGGRKFFTGHENGRGDKNAAGSGSGSGSGSVAKASAITDENLVDVLHECEVVLVGILNQIKSSGKEKSASDQESTQAKKHFLTSTSSSTTTSLTGAVSPHNLLKPTSTWSEERQEGHLHGPLDDDFRTAQPFNQRIPLPSDGLAGMDESSDAMMEDNDDALSREKVKKASSQVLLSQEKKSKRLGHEVQDSPSKAAAAKRSSPERKRP